MSAETVTKYVTGQPPNDYDGPETVTIPLSSVRILGAAPRAETGRLIFDASCGVTLTVGKSILYVGEWSEVACDDRLRKLAEIFPDPA